MSATVGARPSRRRIPWSRTLRSLIQGPPLIALAASAAIGVVFVRPVPPAPAAPVVASRDLRFLGGGDSTILVRDAASGALVARIPAEGKGFAPGFIHALDVLRARYGVPDDRPFRMERLADGRLLLIDPDCPVTIDIESFGPTNERALAHFLDRRAG